MKLWFAVLASLLANALGGVLYPAGGYNGPARGYYGGYGGPAVGYRGALGAGYYGGPGVAYGRPAAVLATGAGVAAADGVRDYANHANAAYNSGARAANYGRNSAAYDDEAARAAARAQQANNAYGHRAADHDRNANAASRAAHQAAADAYGRNHWWNGGHWNKADKHQVHGQGDQWHKGRRHNDNINYAYDKSFDLRDSNNGGFVLAESENHHTLDHLKDRAASYDRNVDKDAAHASAADAKQAAHKAAAAHDAAAHAATSDDFVRHSANNASSYGRNRDWANKVDHSKGASGVWDDARRSASDVYKNLAAKQGNYGHGGYAYAPGVYGLGLAAVPAYAPKPGYAPYGAGYAPYGAGYYGGAPYRAAPLAGPGYVGVDGTHAAGANNQAVRDGLRQSAAAARAHHLQNHYNQDQWLHDRNTGYDRNAHGAAADRGAADAARQAAHSAHKADAASAAVSRASEADHGKASFNEDVSKKEADRTRLSDRDNNHKVYKKWFNNKRRGGDNWERLKLDRDHRDDVFGHDAAFRKDWAKADDHSHWNTHHDANGHNAHAARAAAKAQDAHSDDWKKAADGHQHTNAAADSRNAAQRNGWSNSAFARGHARNAFDVSAGNGHLAHRDASRAGALGAGVGPYGAGVGGLRGPGYGLGYGSGYPAGQYGYPGKLGYGGFPGYGYKTY